MNISEEQKRLLAGALLTGVIVVIIQIAASFGIDVVLPAPTAVPDEFGAAAAGQNPYDCKQSARPCLLSRYGRDVVIYSDNASTKTFEIDGATGDITTARNITTTGSLRVQSGAFATPLAAGQYVAPTAVNTPTPQPTYAYTAPTPQPTISTKTRAINLPLTAFYNCTTNAAIDFSSGADVAPDFAGPGYTYGVSITYDATVGTQDTNAVCAHFVIPPDYLSGGLLRVRAVKETETATNNERVRVTFNRDNDEDVLDCGGLSITATGTTPQTLTPADCTPSFAADIGVTGNIWVSTSDTAIDDVVHLTGIEFVYTSSQ